MLSHQGQDVLAGPPSSTGPTTVVRCLRTRAPPAEKPGFEFRLCCVTSGKSLRLSEPCGSIYRKETMIPKLSDSSGHKRASSTGGAPRPMAALAGRPRRRGQRSRGRRRVPRLGSQGCKCVCHLSRAPFAPRDLPLCQPATNSSTGPARSGRWAGESRSRWGQGGLRPRFGSEQG